MEPLISETYAQCYLKFDEFIHAIPNGVTRAGAPHPFANANDEFVKFKLWAGNLGAAHSGRTYELSLDYRLREASFYKQQVSVSYFLLQVEWPLFDTILKAMCLSLKPRKVLQVLTALGVETSPYLRKSYRTSAVPDTARAIQKRSQCVEPDTGYR